MRRSNQLSYEATDVGSWSFVGSNRLIQQQNGNVTGDVARSKTTNENLE